MVLHNNNPSTQKCTGNGVSITPGKNLPGHEHFMRVAMNEARIALAAGDFPVGCVFVYEKTVVAVGRRRNSTGQLKNEMDHAEIIALRDLYMRHPEIDRAGITVYSTMEPCLMCFSTLALNGIRTIVYGFEDPMGGGTDLPLHRLTPLYREMEIKVIPHVLRKDCLDIFRHFFQNKNNHYWQGSFLAEYTLSD